MFKNKYKIVRDDFCGYEVRIKRWWLPLWYQAGWTNTHSSVEKAREYAKSHSQNHIVKYLGEL